MGRQTGMAAPMQRASTAWWMCRVPTMTGCTHAASFICGLSPQFPANMSKVRLRCCRVSALMLRGSCKPLRELMKQQARQPCS